MGFSGAFVLASTADPDGLSWLGEYDECDRLEGDWVSFVFPDEDAFWEREETLAQLVDQTGRPALIGLTLDSDFLGVVGRTRDGTTWDGVVDRGAAAAYRAAALDEGHDAVIPEFSTSRIASANAREWAAAAGLEVDEAALVCLFSGEGIDRPAHLYWDDLLSALGATRPGAAAPDPAPRPALPSARKPAKPLDQVIRDWIAPALKDAGFTRKGRKFTLERPDGARAFTSIRPYVLGQNDVEFHMDVFVQPRIWRDFAAFRNGHDSEWDMWRDRVMVPARDGRWMSGTWSFDLGDNDAGRSLAHAAGQLARTAGDFLDPAKLLAHVQSGAPRGTANMVRDDVVVVALLAATQGSSPALDERLAALDRDLDSSDFNQPFTAFISAWIAER